MLMQHLLLDAAARTPDRLAFRWVDRDRSLTYRQAVAAMEQYAGALHEVGVGKGDRVTVFAHNGLDYLMTMFGAWRLGAISALVNVRYADELDYYISDHSPKVIVYTHDMAEPVRRAVSAARGIRHLICMDGPQDGALSLPELLSARLPVPQDPGDESAIAHLSYTSGTSGKPKGACLSHEPTARACRCIAERLRITAADVSFGPTALSSSYQLVGNLLPPLSCGATINVARHWRRSSGWQAIDDLGVTMFMANPTLLGEVLIESRRRGRPPGKLRFAMSGGGPVPPTLKRSWRDELKVPLVESYGQSELGGFVALGEPALPSEADLNRIGRPLPDKEVRIFDDSDRVVACGGVGEIVLRGGFMSGYWNKPEKTAHALRGGWLHTGDAGTIDNDGYVTMRGRFSERVTVAGEVWFPRDIEEALALHSAVKEAAVIGIPDSRLGQQPKAFVTLVEGREALPEELHASIRGKVRYDLSLLEVTIIDSFPMTPTGKIAKVELLARARPAVSTGQDRAVG